MSPTPRAVVALGLVALSAFWLPVEVAGFAMAVVIAVGAIDAWSVRVAPVVTRAVPVEVVRGVAVTLTVEVGGPVPAARVAVRQPQTAEVRVTPSEAQGRLDAELLATSRGEHQLPPVVTRTVGPLGLARWTHGHGAATTIAAHADLPGARRIAHAVQQGRFRDPGQRRGPLGLGTDFESVREYTPDDDIRRMNWLASERTGRPMVNQYREDTDRELWCLVDQGRLLSSPVGDRTRLDAALDAVAAVAAVADVLGDRVGVVVFDDQVREVMAPRRANAASIMRRLDLIQPTLTDTDHEAAFAQVAGSKRALVMVFTDLLDVAASRPLTDAMAVLTRRHAVVVATITDPDLLAAVDAEPVRRRDTYVAEVAGTLLAERRTVEATLAALGGRVADAPPDAFPSRCVGAYLQLKAQSRL